MSKDSTSQPTNDASAWKVLTKKYKITDDIEIDKKYIQREDGLSLIWENGAAHLAHTFLCNGSFGEFRFFAIRWDELENIPMDTYIVWVKTFSKNWPGDSEKNKELILSHAKDIESGLLHYPLSGAFHYQLVKEVLFDVSGFKEPSQLVHAEEIQG